MRIVPQAVLHHGRHHLRGLPHSAAQVDNGLPSLLKLEERHVGASTASLPKSDLQERVVHGASHSLLHGPITIEREIVRRRRVDETYVGGKEKNKPLGKRQRGNLGGKGKAPVVSLEQRDGSVRSFAVDKVTMGNLRKALLENVDLKARVMTDSLNLYGFVATPFARLETVDHTTEEYVRGDVYTNTVESVFSLLKRGVYGTFHHVSKKHLHRYLDEFDFRWNTRTRLGVTDDQRTDIALKRAEGKRLTYRQPIAAIREKGQMSLF